LEQGDASREAVAIKNVDGLSAQVQKSYGFHKAKADAEVKQFWATAPSDLTQHNASRHCRRGAVIQWSMPRYRGPALPKGRTMAILDATPLDTDPAGCELLLSIFGAGTRQRECDRALLRARTASRPGWRSRFEAERPAGAARWWASS
jgi:hypothetical protein